MTPGTPPSARPGVRLSVVIPAYNEERKLPRALVSVVRYLSRQRYGSEVVVVDDGSTDRTADVVHQATSESIPVRLIRHPDGSNHGKGAAVRRGMRAATGQYRLYMDSDHSTTVDQIESFWPYFDEGYHVVIGSRKAKALAGNIGNLLVQWLSVPDIVDAQAGFQAFTARVAADVFPRLTIDRWGFALEALAACRRRGYRIKGAPITWVNHPEGTVPLPSSFEVLCGLWRVQRNVRAGLYD